MTRAQFFEAMNPVGMPPKMAEDAEPGPEMLSHINDN
jgi:hypothetical protein